MKQLRLFTLTVYTLATLLAYVPATLAIKINDCDINEYCQPYQAALFYNDATSGVIIRITNGDITIGSVPINDTQLHTITDAYTDLELHKKSLDQNYSQEALISCTKNPLGGYRAHATDEQIIILDDDTIIDIADSILDAPLVAYISSIMNISNCFIHTRQLHFQSSRPDSLIEAIIFVFDEDTTVPPLVQGCIDFSTDTTINDIIVCGAREVHLLFKPEAFKSQNERELASSYGTHMACLITAAVNTTGPILEMGAGDYSTPLLHAVCSKDKRYLLSTDTDKLWLSHFTDLETDWHEFKYVNVYEDDWELNPQPELWDTIGGDRHWSVVFIDHRPGERRVVDIARLRPNTDIFVIHDTEQWGYSYEPVLNSFKYKYTDRRYTTYTTVVSDTIDVAKFFGEQ